ncbi:hypothetical protein Tco_0106442, partial [Tanacetum coccineum]
VTPIKNNLKQVFAKESTETIEDDNVLMMEETIEDDNGLKLVLNNMRKAVFGEICKEDVEVKENESKDSKEDDDNKKCLLITNDIVKGGKRSKESNGWFENQIPFLV